MFAVAVRRVALLLGLFTTAAHALEIVPERLVGSGDRLWPAPFGTIVGAATAHAAGQYVVFFSEASDGGSGLVHGVWLWDGVSCQLVIDSTMLEGTSGLLAGQIYSVDESGLVVVNVENYGLIAWKDGILTPIFLVGDEPPGGPPGRVFESFTHPVLDDGTVYFLAGFVGVQGDVRMYAWTLEGGPVQFGLGVLQSPGVPTPTAGGVLFGAADPQGNPFHRTIWFREPAGAITLHFRFDSPLPGEPPGSYWTPIYHQLGVTDSGFVVGGAASTNQTTGIFRVAGGVVEPVAVKGEPDPASGHPFVGFDSEFAARGERIAATMAWGPSGTTVGKTLLLQDVDRSIYPVVSEGGILDGQPVGFFHVTYGGLSADRLAFDAWRPSDVAVWLVDLTGEPVPSLLEVPALGPGAAAVFVAALAVVAAGVLRRRRSTVC